MNGISTFLWFANEAEAAAQFYVSVFPNSAVTNVTRQGDPVGDGLASALMVSFELDGRQFTALNGGPLYTFSPAISFVVSCDGQAEVDEFWDRLSSGGSEGQCGWLTDRFGLSWQIVPTALATLIGGEDRTGASRAVQAMLQMRKLDIQKLADAYYSA